MEEADLSSLLKGKLSLADAMKQIDIVSTTLKKTDRIEKKLTYHESLLSEAKDAMESFSTCSYVDNKFKDFTISFEQMIKSKFEEFTSQYLFQLNEKVSLGEIEGLLSQRVTWIAFNNMSQQINVVKTRFDKYILSEFEGFKTKIKLELSHKANEKRPEDEMNMEEIHQLKNRLTSLEQKYQDMFMEEGLDDSEDYDSQEAMDNMIDDVEIGGLAKDKGSDEGANEGDEQEEFHEIGRKFQMPQLAEVPKLPIPLGGSFHSPPFTSPEINSPRSENTDNVKTEVSEDSSKNLALNSNKEEAPKSSSVSIPQESPIKPKETEPEKPSANLPEVPSEHIYGLQPKPKSRSSIEIDSPEQVAPRHVRGKGSSRADGQTLTRKNSMESSMGGTNMGGGGAGMNSGLRQLNKKVTALQKEIEGFKADIDDTKSILNDYKNEFEKVYIKIGETRARCEEVEDKRQAMEMSFIKALRRNGIDKKDKSKQKVVATIDTAALMNLQEQINRKAKKIKTISTYVEKVAADTMHIKDKQNHRINEIIQSIKFLDQSRNSITKQLVSISSTVRIIEEGLKNNISDVHNEVMSLRGPLTDLISDQQRENQILDEDIKKQHLLFKEVIQEYSTKCATNSKAVSPEKTQTFSSRPPNLSIKHQISNNSNNLRRSSVSTHQNWLEDVPDGTPIVLPRIRMSSLSFTERVSQS